MRFLVITAAAAATVTLAAQQKPPATFRSSVALVAVDVTVLDSDGRPVPGLAAEDFQIKLNGKIQPVRTLSYVRAVEPSVGPAVEPAFADLVPAGRAAVTNIVPVKDPKIFVLAIDDLSFPPEGGRRTLTAARSFVEAQPAGVLVGLTTTSGSVAVNPTADHMAISAALKHVVGEFIDPRRSSSPTNPSVGIAEAIEISEHNNSSVLRVVIARECLDAGIGQSSTDPGVNPNANAVGTFGTKCATDVMSSARLIATTTQGTTNRQVASIANVLGAMKGAPGLKQMVVLSQGVAATRDVGSVFERINKAAAAAGVQLTVLMEDDDEGDVSNQNMGRNDIGQTLHNGTGIASRRRDDRRMFLAALQTLADTSGGTFEHVISSPADAFKRAAIAGSAVYRLGVEAPSDAGGSKPIQVTATVARPDLTVHANHSAVLAAADAPETAAEQVASAIKHGKPYYAVPMRVAVARRRAAPASGTDNLVELGVGVAVPSSVAGPLRVTIGVMDSAGGLKQGTRAVPAPDGHADYRLTVPMPVAPGKYRVRLAVEDANGAVGSVETSIDASLQAMGAFSASDLLTWWKDAAGRPQFLTLDEIPAGVTNLSAGLELYKSSGSPVPADVKVRLSLIAAGSVEPAAEIDLTPRMDGDVLRVESSLPLASLAPGTYVIRATVFAGGQRIGDASASIRKRSSEPR
jgi:VWFA-related protein